MTAAAAPSVEAVPGASRPRSVLAVSTLAAALDGFDGQAMAFVAPSIARDWGLGLPVFGAVFSLGLVGLIVGGLFVAPLGDRAGRKRLIVYSGVGVGLAMIATIFASTIPQLIVLRFLTGVCLGAMMPGLVTIAHEAPTPRHRTRYVTILMCGFPLGGFFGGMLSAWAIPAFGWEALFVVSGAATLAVAALLAAVLEREAPRPRATTRASAPTGLALLQPKLAAATLVLWLLFFATLLNLYLVASWLPSLLERDGFSPAQAAMAAGLSNLGGVVGGLGLGFLVSRYGASVLSGAFLIGAAALIGLGFVAGSATLAVAAAFVVGIAIAGGQVCNNALAAARYPASIRATGIGWAQGVGRIGSVIGPALVGLALAREMSNREIFAGAAVLAVVGALAAFLLSRLRAPEAEPVT